MMEQNRQGSLLGPSKVERGMVFCIAGILLAFLAMRLRLPIVPISLRFLLIVLLIVLATGFWWFWGDRRLRGIESVKWRRWFRGAWSVHMVFVLSPLVFVMLGRSRLYDAYPVWAIMWLLNWHMLSVMLSSCVTVFVAGRWLWRGAVRVWYWWVPEQSGPSMSPADSAQRIDRGDSSRRALLQRVIVAAPLAVVGASVVRGLSTAGRFEVRRLKMSLPGLPSRLRGLTITHISDLHVGRLFQPAHLPRMVDAANRLDSDLVVVTGDLVDHSIDYLPAAAKAIEQLEHRHGRFVIVGNHDLIDAPLDAVTFLSARERQFRFLVDNYLPVVIGGETLQVAGLFWSRHDERTGRDPGHVERAARALNGADEDRFTIGLAHHPHAFDALAGRGVDLTLSGHTHGGQLMLTPPGASWAFGAGNLLFRYIWGEYRRGPAALYVNAGVGNWFPVRMNAPAEIVQLQLV